MNRPKIEDYQEKIEIENGWETRLKTVKYRVDLENYCDELEKINKKLTELVDLSTSKYPIVKVDKNNLTVFKCPTCGSALVGTCTECYRKIKFCDQCGQKYDTEWSAEYE